MKPNEIPTDTFAAGLDDAQLEKLESVLTDSDVTGPADALRLEIQLEQIRRGGRRKERKTHDADESALKNHLVGLHHSQRIRIAEFLKTARGSRNKLEKPDRDFHGAIYGFAGDDSFADRMLAALRGLDSEFFEQVTDFIRTMLEVESKEQRGVKADTEKPSFALHVSAGNSVLWRLREAGEPIPAKGELETLIWRELRKRGAPPYEDASDWRKLWRALGITANHPQTRPGRTPKGRKP